MPLSGLRSSEWSDVAVGQWVTARFNYRADGVVLPELQPASAG